jgi:23S rRNA (uracil1939-C5)-methyltransferase
MLDALFHAELNIVSTFYALSAQTNSVIIKNPVYNNGTGTVVMDTCFGSYRMFPTAFFQANICTLNKILKTIRENISRHPDESILDLYSGCGVLSNHSGMKRSCVESNGSSFGSIEKDEFTEFVVSDATGIIERINNDGYGIIIADPPRKGIEEELVKAINDSNAHTFIYLSCDPFTQKRDIELLTNYRIDSITAYDMFPNTVHIESLVILKRK